MASNRTRGIHKPFEGLDRLLKRKALPIARSTPRHSTEPHARPISPRQEAELFAAEMADVVPVACDRYWEAPRNTFHPNPQNETDMADSDLKALCLLVETGRGFKISLTPEYMEARGPGIRPEICRRLHSGHYSIQDHVDLHGLTVPEAEQALDAFIKKAIIEGKRAVLVIHGRGLSSPHEPVLKKCVYGRLTSGRWKRYVIALTSARGCDGGAGASYVLLRQRPQRKKQKSPAF